MMSTNNISLLTKYYYIYYYKIIKWITLIESRNIYKINLINPDTQGTKNQLNLLNINNNIITLYSVIEGDSSSRFNNNKDEIIFRLVCPIIIVRLDRA